MFEMISNFWRVGEIRRKILFTLLMLIVFRIGTFIPVPYVNAEILAAQDQLSVFGVLNTFGGGALKNFSILAITNGCCTQVYRVVKARGSWAS